MNATQQDKLSMYLALIAVVDSQKTAWQSLPAFGAGVEDLREAVSEIQSLAQTQASKTGTAADKAQSLEVLGDAAYEIAAATRALAVAAGNKQLAGRVDFPRSAVDNGRASTVVARCQDIHSAAVEVLESLSDYGVTAAKLAALKKKTEKFQSLQPMPRQGRATSRAATKQLPALFKLADEVLNERLDKLAVQFKASEPTFFNEYTTARLVVRSPGGRATKDEDTVALPATSVTLPKAA